MARTWEMFHRFRAACPRRGRAYNAFAALVGAGLACLAGPAVPQESPPSDRFVEDVTVREVELVVELPPDRAWLTPSEILVTVDGLPRPVTRAGPIGGDAEPWNLLIYVDRVLAGPDAVHTAALALAGRAEELVALGSVEVAVADPEPRLVLPAVRGAFAVSEALAPLAAETRRASGNIPIGGFQGFQPAPDPAVLRRQYDALIAFAASLPARGPRVLLLVADGFELPPEAVAALETGELQATGGTTPLVAPIAEAARALAAYGWITLALPLQASPDKPAWEPTDAERFRAQVWEDAEERAFISVIPWIRDALGLEVRRPETPGETRLAIVPRLAPLRAISATTGGELVGYGSQLDPALADLWRRWTIFYTSTDPLDGRLQPLVARVAGTQLSSPAWVRSSIPLVVTEARLRRLLAAAAAPEAPDEAARAQLRGDLPLTVTRNARTLKLALPTAIGPIRIARAQGAEIHHETHPATPGPWSHTLTLPSAGPIALIVEDLGRERWAGKVLELD